MENYAIIDKVLVNIKIERRVWLFNLLNISYKRKMSEILEIVEHTLLDSIKLLPFLFITYLLMEFLEHKTSSKINGAIKKSGKFGPAIGGVLGLLPQCGFSVMATNLYMGRIITLGTLISIYLTTSDEMLPILISSNVPVITIIKILAIKLVIGMLAGFIIDLIVSKFKKKEQVKEEAVDFCEHEHCHCEEGIFKSAIRHTVNIFIFILAITFVLNAVIHFIGEDTLSNFIMNNKIFGPIIASLIGLIPNCASSVIISQLYVENVISAAIMISGLLVNAGVGLLVLFRVNRNLKENMKITAILYGIGVVSGIILECIGLTL